MGAMIGASGHGGVSDAAWRSLHTEHDRFWNSEPRGYSLLGAGLSPLAWHAWLLQKGVLEIN